MNDLTSDDWRQLNAGKKFKPFSTAVNKVGSVAFDNDRNGAVCGPAALRRRDAKPDLEIGVDLDDALHTSANLQQKQIKYGLTDPSAIACHEAGFGDRHVASILNLVWGNVVDRVGVRAACQQEKIVRAVLVHIPSYSPGSLLNLEDGLGARHDQIRRSERELFVCDRARCTLVADASQQRLF